MSEMQIYRKNDLNNSKLWLMNDKNPPITKNNPKNNEKFNFKNAKQSQQSSQHVQNKSKNIKQEKNDLCCQTQKVKYYLYAWILFVIAFCVYILIWIIGHFSIQRLTSDWYFKDYNISPYTHIDIWKLSKRATNSSVQSYVTSNTLYYTDDLKKADAIVLSLFFSWLMWKFPLTLFTLKIIRHKSHSLQRYSTFGFFIILLLLIDIMVTILKPQGYQDWIFFAIYVALSSILIAVNGLRAKSKLLRNFKNFMYPIIYITLAYACFSILIPAVYGAMYKSYGQDAPYVIVHVFPLVDFIFYSMIIVISYACDSHTLKFIKMFQFLNVGYAVGHVILFSPDDVEFYYLVTYFMIRNISFNWILQKIQKYVIIPCPQPGWIMIYLVSLSVNFIPFIGFGKLVISKSFYSQILQLTLPIQSYMLPQDFYAYYSSNLPLVSTFNPSLKGNIQLSSVFIIWVAMTITQKHHISKIQFKQFFFYIFAIYMFYFGLATGTQLYYLSLNSL